MAEEKEMSEQESLRLITEMIQKARSSFHESGASAILWGTVVAIAGLTSFAERFWNFDLGFDVWLIVLAAFIPQIIISIRESRRKKAVGYEETAVDAIWVVYGISVFMLTFYLNVVPGVTERFFAADGTELVVRDLKTGIISHHEPTVISGYSLLLLLYAMPTLATGIARRFTPMLVGGVLCYIYFMISCFTTTTYDLLLNGLAGITCWLIPGLILRNRFLKGKHC